MIGRLNPIAAVLDSTKVALFGSQKDGFIFNTKDFSFEKILGNECDLNFDASTPMQRTEQGKFITLGLCEKDNFVHAIEF